MLVVFFGLGVAAASILGGQGEVVDASKPHLPMNVDVSKHASQKRSPCNKTIVFAMFYRLRNMPHTATKHVSCVAFEAFLDMVQWWLPKIPAGLHFLLFITTLKRGGTCTAHGIRCLLKIASWRLPASIWEAPGLDFGASQARFQRFFRIFWEGAFQVSPPRNAS